MFISVDRQHDKISPVTEQGYEIIALIEFAVLGERVQPLNIIDFDRLMKQCSRAWLPRRKRDREWERERERNRKSK